MRMFFLQKGNHRWDHIYAEKLGQNEIARRDEISFCTCYVPIRCTYTECHRERKPLLSFMRLLLANESKVDFPSIFIINLETISSRYLYFFFFFTDVFEKRCNSSSFPFLFSRFIELIKRRH